MSRPVVPIEYRFTQAQIDAGDANALSGVRIVVIDSNGQPTGTVYESGPSGQAPSTLATSQTVQQQLGGQVEKVQITGGNTALTPSTTGKVKEFHVEAGGSLATFTTSSWPLPAAGSVAEFRVQNHTGGNITFTAGTGYMLVTMDGNPTESQTITIPDNTKRVFTVDSDGFIQTLAGSEVSRGEFNSALQGKADVSALAAKVSISDIAHNLTETTSLRALSAGMGKALNDSKVSTIVTGTIDANNDALQSNTLYVGNDTGSITNGPTSAWAWSLWHMRIGVWRYQMVWNGTAVYFRSANAALTGATWIALAATGHTHAVADITALQPALDAKQATLVSGTNIKTVNSQTLVGSGDIVITGGGQVAPLLAEARYWYSADTYDFVNNTGPNLGAGGQPITGVSGKLPGIASINGRPAWGLYISTTDYRGLTAVNQMSTTQAIEIFFVKKMRNTAAIDNLIHWNGGDASRNLTHFPYSDATVYFDAGSSDASGRLTVAGGLANNDVFIGGLAANASYQAIRKNGAVLASDTNIGTMTFTGGLRLGWGVVNGDIAEVLIFNRVLSQSEREFVEGYLAKKYGVTLTGGHLFA